MTWISVNDRMPNDVWIYDMSAEFPMTNWETNIDQISFECLANFVDVDNGRVFDCEVVQVLYNTRDGWMRQDYSPFDEQELTTITHWMFIPKSVDSEIAQSVYNENVKKVNNEIK